MNTFLSERSASGKSGSTASPMASFTRFMIAVTAAFVALCAALAWSSVLALTSFGQTAYLPRPVPLPFSFTSSLCLLVWCVGLWGTWKTPPLPAVGEAASSEAQPTLAAAAALQRRSTQQFKDKAAAVVETSTAATARDDGIALIVVGQSSSETAEPRQ